MFHGAGAPQRIGQRRSPHPGPQVAAERAQDFGIPRDPRVNRDACILAFGDERRQPQRRAVGYARHEGASGLKCLNELYRPLRLHTNFFQPVMKLVRKERHGAKVKKTYDAPKTPYRRLLALPGIAKAQRRQLDAQYAQLNPAQLERDITRLQQRLIRGAHTRSRACRHRPGVQPRHDTRT